MSEAPEDGATRAGRARVRWGVSLERGLGAPALFAIAYSTVGSSIYFALGIVAERSLGLTPLVFLAAGLLFAITIMTYVEGAALHPEPGGSSVFARHAFNEFWSFVAGWAILLDYVILIAIAAFSVPNYLVPFWSKLGHPAAEIPIALAVIAAIAVANLRGFGTRQRRNAIGLAVVDLAAQLVIVALGLALMFDWSALTAEIDLGSTPTWRDLVYAAVIATIAYTGIEAASNLAPEVRSDPRSLKRMVVSGTATALTVTVGISTVALMVVPPHRVGGEVVTELGGRFEQAPVLGVVQSFEPSWIGGVLEWSVAVLAALVLAQAANAGMLGVTRLSYALATNRQIPSALARLHPRYLTPFVAVTVFAVIAGVLVLPTSLDFLAGIYAFGAMLAFTIAHASICVLRYKEPDRERLFSIPLSVRAGRGSLPLPAVAGAVLSFAAWVSVIALHRGAAIVGGSWLLGGLVLYLVYRRLTGKPITERVEVEPEALAEPPDIEIGTILVPVFGTPLDDDIMGTAGRLAAAETGESGRGARITALYVLRVPVSLPLDAALPPEQTRAAEAALERAKRVGEEYEGVRVMKRSVRAREVGSAIVTESERLAVEAIVMGGEEPSRLVGGSLLGGVVPTASRFAGPITSYVVEKAPCRVLLTAPPLWAGERGGAPTGPAAGQAESAS